METDGWVTIGFKGDSKQLEKDIAEAKRELAKYEREAEKLATTKEKTDLGLKEYYERKQLIIDANKEIENSARTEKSKQLSIEANNQVLKQLNAEYDKELSKVQEIDRKIADNKTHQELLKGSIEEATIELEKQKKMDGLRGVIEGVKNSMKDVVKTAIKWGLAIFSIRSMYNLIRQSISTLSSENDQISGDLQYMQWILAQTLKPVVEWLIKGLYFVIGLINSISKALFGIDILAGKSADAFKQAQENTKGMSSNLKDAKKQLAGFDEMNVLQDTSSQGAGGGGGLGDWKDPGIGDYTNEIEKVAEAFKNFKEDMKSTLENTTMDDWMDAFGNWGVFMRGLTESVLGLVEIVSGVFNVIAGLVKAFIGLITGDTKMLNEGIQQIVDGLLEFIAGCVDLLVGILHMLMGIIVGIVLDIFDAVISLAKSIVDTVTNVAITIGNWLGDRISDFIDLCVKVFTTLVDWLTSIIKGIGNFIGDVINWILGIIKAIPTTIMNIFSSIVNWIKNNVVNPILNLFKDIGTNVGNVISSAFKAVVNGVLGAIEKILNFPIKSINKLIDVINAVPGINLGKLSTFSLPRLAKGGIINQPGRGIAVGGEHGAEGVIPLTDSQQMALLGEAIGKYINIHATIPVYVGNRQIVREMRKIEAENEFAYNS